jgi:hypothetical protein
VTVKDAVYNVHDPVKVAAQQIHLPEEQRKKLATLFSKRSVLFSGRIGCYTKRKFSIKFNDPERTSVDRRNPNYVPPDSTWLSAPRLD